VSLEEYESMSLDFGSEFVEVGTKVDDMSLDTGDMEGESVAVGGNNDDVDDDDGELYEEVRLTSDTIIVDEGTDVTDDEATSVDSGKIEDGVSINDNDGVTSEVDMGVGEDMTEDERTSLNVGVGIRSGVDENDRRALDVGDLLEVDALLVEDSLPSEFVTILEGVGRDDALVDRVDAIVRSVDVFEVLSR
jgi:hypothetical protein